MPTEYKLKRMVWVTKTVPPCFLGEREAAEHVRQFAFLQYLPELNVPGIQPFSSLCSPTLIGAMWLLLIGCAWLSTDECGCVFRTLWLCLPHNCLTWVAFADLWLDLSLSLLHLFIYTGQMVFNISCVRKLIPTLLSSLKLFICSIHKCLLPLPLC